MKSLIIFIFALFPLIASAQEENGTIREGNEAYEQKQYKDAEVNYRKALLKNSESYPALSNLGSAMFRQGLYGDAEQMWARAIEVDSMSSQANYNMGSAQLAQRKQDPAKLDAAIESFKQALRLNPRDDMARYNLAYALALKNNEDGGGGGGEDNQDQNQDQQDQQNQDDQNQDQQDQNQDKEQNKDQQEQQQQGEKPQSRADAERMADAIQAAEDRTKEKVDKEKAEAVGVGSGGKSW